MPAMGAFSGFSWSNRATKWLWFTAGLELLLAVIFLNVGAFGPSEAKGGMYLTAAILGGVGILLVLWARSATKNYERAQALRQSGLAGTARVLSAEFTGTTMNEVPYMRMDLEVTIPGRPPYQVEHKDYVPIGRQFMLGPHATIPVKVNPNDPTDLVIEWEGASINPVVVTTPFESQPAAGAGGFGALAGAMLLGAAAAAAPSAAGTAASTAGTAAGAADAQYASLVDRVRSTGLDAVVTVNSARDMGVGVPEGALFDLELTLNLPGQPAVAVKQHAIVPPDDAPKLKPGVNLPAKATAGSPPQFVILWDRV